MFQFFFKLWKKWPDLNSPEFGVRPNYAEFGIFKTQLARIRHLVIDILSKFWKYAWSMKYDIYIFHSYFAHKVQVWSQVKVWIRVFQNLLIFIQPGKSFSFKRKIILWHFWIGSMLPTDIRNQITFLLKKLIPLKNIFLKKRPNRPNSPECCLNMPPSK